MTPSVLLASLFARGLSIRADKGTLYVSPTSLLTEEDKTEIRAHKRFLLEVLTEEPEPQDPFAPDYTGRAYSPETIAVLARMAEHNNRVLASMTAATEAKRERREKGRRAVTEAEGVFEAQEQTQEGTT